MNSTIGLIGLPFTIWMRPLTGAMLPILPVLADPVPRGIFWAGAGYAGLQYLKPQALNIYNGETPQAFKLGNMSDPDATYTPPWLIAGFMGYLAMEFM